MNPGLYLLRHLRYCPRHPNVYGGVFGEGSRSDDAAHFHWFNLLFLTQPRHPVLEMTRPFLFFGIASFASSSASPSH